MVTTTTAPLRLRLVPSYQGESPEPAMNAPPWHQNITGRLRPSLTAGVHTLSTRQFSLIGGSSRPANSFSIAGGSANALSSCIARSPNSKASRTPVHGPTSFGGANRPSSLGGAAYGMPLKTLTSFSSIPRIFPQLVSTTTVCAMIECPPCEETYRITEVDVEAGKRNITVMSG